MPDAAVRHVVLLALEEKTDTATINKLISSIQNLTKLSCVKSLQCGKQLTAIDDGRNATVMAVVDLADTEVYKTYASHPKHKQAIEEFILPNLKEGGRSAIQFYLNEAPTTSNAIVHTVLLKLNENVEATMKENMVDAINQLGISAFSLVQNLVCGSQILSIDDGRNATVAATVTFKSDLDYVEYSKHPKHLKVITEFVSPNLAKGGRSSCQISTARCKTFFKSYELAFGLFVALPTVISSFYI